MFIDSKVKLQNTEYNINLAIVKLNTACMA